MLTKQEERILRNQIFLDRIGLLSTKDYHNLSDLCNLEEQILASLEMTPLPTITCDSFNVINLNLSLHI
jgi:hypothetical protein